MLFHPNEKLRCFIFVVVAVAAVRRALSRQLVSSQLPRQSAGGNKQTAPLLSFETAHRATAPTPPPASVAA